MTAVPPPLATLDGIEFRVLRAEGQVVFRLSLETLALLRDRFAPSFHGSPLQLFGHLRDEILELVERKLESAFSADEMLAISIDDVLKVFDI